MSNLQSIGTTVTEIVSSSVVRFGSYLPQLVGGLILLIVGLFLASVLRSVILKVLRWINIERWLGEVQSEVNKVLEERPARSAVWSEVIAELVRWTVIILFLIPAAEAFGIPRVTEVFNQFLLYIPNVFVAVVIAFIGLVVANLVSDVVRNAARDLGSNSAHVLSDVARWALVFFTSLVVLNQLGVAADLVRILFTGIVAMLALAGGIAFGLGGQNNARGVLDGLQRRLGGHPVTNTVRVARTSPRRRSRK